MMRTYRKLSLITAATLGATAFASAPAGARTDADSLALGPIVTEWNEAAGRAALAACIAPLDNPLHESRMYAMGHLAMHDALNAIDRRSRPYAADFRAPRNSSVRAAVAAAARTSLVSAIADITAPFPQACRDAGTAVVEDYYAAQLAMVADGKSKRDGMATGERAASRVIAGRDGDGSDTPLIVEDYDQGTEPGDWVFTPDRPFAFAPGWGSVKPFALRAATQFPTAPPLPLGGDGYARDLASVKSLGGDGVTTPTTRTPTQTQIAMFWLESSPLAWNRIGRELAMARHLDPWAQSRFFGLLNAALADGYIASFAKKYANPFWRPVTAIREAGTDGNPRTSPDPTWTPLATTPPIPDHDSAHSVEGGAAAAVFREFFGTDRVKFSACSNTLPSGGCGSSGEVRRHFGAFSGAARENARSRVYIGFHFPHASAVGLRHGDLIGDWTAHAILRPVG